MRDRLLTFATLFALLSAASQMHAQVVLVPPGLTPGDPYHLMFVSSAQSDTNFGPNGITDADAFVQNLADIAGIGSSQGITWQSVLSDSTTSAISRFNPTAPIYDLQGNRIAASGAALWNAGSVPLENPIAFDENGNGGIFPEVWTGTDPTGVLNRADSDWMAAPSTQLATSGLAFSVNGQWIDTLDTSEDVPQSLFATSSQLTVPGSVVPEPAAWMLWLLLAAAIGYRLVKSSGVPASAGTG